MKKTVKVIAVTSLSITLIGCLAFIYILLRTNIIFKNQTVADAGIKDNIKLEDVSKITVTYKGDKAFAGGRLSKADFVVEVTENNGRKRSRWEGTSHKEVLFGICKDKPDR